MSADKAGHWSRDWLPFPTDELTLTLLIAACESNPDTGRTHLHDFLYMGTEPTATTRIAGSDDPEDHDPPVYFVEYAEGQEPHSPNTVIITLAEEILRLRSVAPGADQETT